MVLNILPFFKFLFVLRLSGLIDFQLHYKNEEKKFLAIDLR